LSIVGTCGGDAKGHTMFGSMADIQSVAAEIRRGKKKKKKKKKKNKPQHENIMVCPITYGDHNNGMS